jgi:hypothetical protein
LHEAILRIGQAILDPTLHEVVIDIELRELQSS